MKPSSATPDLAVTMKALEEKLRSVGRVDYTYTVTRDNINTVGSFRRRKS